MPPKKDSVIENTDSSPVPAESLKSLYLVLYNNSSALFWGSILLRVAIFLPILGIADLHTKLSVYTTYIQSAAILEVFHCFFGIVRSPVVTTAIQVSSRLLIVWGIFYLLPSSPALSHFAFTSLLVSWGITEVIRYYFYMLNVKNGQVAQWLVWLRYNTFYILYPTGVASEMTIIYLSIDEAINVIGEWYGWLLKVILLIYIPGFYVMYTHMIKQRRKALGKNIKKTQ